MSELKKIEKLKKVIEAFKKEREQHEMQLQRIDSMIAKKKSFIEKMVNYKNDYDVVQGVRLTHSIPALMLNLKQFIKKMDDSIAKEEKSIQMYMKDRNTIEERIQRVDQKIKAMDVLINKYDKKKRIKDEERENDHFDMLSTSHLKGAL